MTRINVIPPSELCDQHLLAEFRELTRIPNGVLYGRYKRDYPDRPSQYTLGEGHVKFFTDKLHWLYNRYNALTYECQKRGFKIVPKFPQVHESKINSWQPTETDMAVNRQRIAERMPKRARWYGKERV